jgi:POT family proton-dependent oligopeptide transporter
VASLSPFGTTALEQKFGFPSAFALPTVVFMLGLAVLVASRRRIVSEIPHSSVLSNAFKVLRIGLMHGSLEAAKPSSLKCTQRPETMHWNDAFVDELSRALKACRLFLFFPLYWMAWLQMMSNFISQAGTMETHGIPNDVLTNLDPLTVIVMVPLLEQFIYPLLRRIGIALEPITRVTIGFVLIAIAMAYAAVLQHFIYASPPCYNYPRASDCLGGEVPNQIHVAVQMPAYILVALSEVFAVPTGYQWAFTKAPAGMRSLVMALFLLTVALGALLAVLVSPLTVDPKLTWMYGGLSTASFFNGVLFWLVAHNISKDDAEIRIESPGIVQGLIVGEGNN